MLRFDFFSGTIEFFHRAKAFGVIAGDDGESYYFYPHSFAERYKPKRGLWKPVMKKVVPGTPVEFYWNEGTNSKTYESIRKVWSYSKIRLKLVLGLADNGNGWSLNEGPGYGARPVAYI